MVGSLAVSMSHRNGNATDKKSRFGLRGHPASPRRLRRASPPVETGLNERFHGETVAAWGWRGKKNDKGSLRAVRGYPGRLGGSGHRAGLAGAEQSAPAGRAQAFAYIILLRQGFGGQVDRLGVAT